MRSCAQWQAQERIRPQWTDPFYRRKICGPGEIRTLDRLSHVEKRSLEGRLGHVKEPLRAR